MWQSILARLGLRTDRVRSPQTLAAANRRQRDALEAARTGIAELADAETRLAGSPDLAAVRLERARLENASEALRMRIELFRSEKLAAGSGFVHAGSIGRGGDTLADLHAETAALLGAVDAARQRVRALTTTRG